VPFGSSRGVAAQGESLQRDFTARSIVEVGELSIVGRLPEGDCDAHAQQPPSTEAGSLRKCVVDHAPGFIKTAESHQSLGVAGGPSVAIHFGRVAEGIDRLLVLSGPFGRESELAPRPALSIAGGLDRFFDRSNRLAGVAQEKFDQPDLRLCERGVALARLVFEERVERLARTGEAIEFPPRGAEPFERAVSRS